MAQLWGGRFTKETDQLVYRFNASIDFDRKFYRQDIKGSMAHVKNAGKTADSHRRRAGSNPGGTGGYSADVGKRKP